MAPRVLVSDDLSSTAVQILRDRGIEVDFDPTLGKDKERLASVIAGYDGLAIRSATKVTAKLLDAAPRLRVVGRAGIGVDNVDIPAASRKGVIVMNTPFGNAITTAEHAIAMMFALARQIHHDGARRNADLRGGETDALGGIHRLDHVVEQGPQRVVEGFDGTCLDLEAGVGSDQDFAERHAGLGRRGARRGQAALAGRAVAR